MRRGSPASRMTTRSSSGSASFAAWLKGDGELKVMNGDLNAVGRSSGGALEVAGKTLAADPAPPLQHAWPWEQQI